MFGNFLKIKYDTKSRYNAPLIQINIFIFSLRFKKEIIYLFSFIRQTYGNKADPLHSLDGTEGPSGPIDEIEDTFLLNIEDMSTRNDDFGSEYTS